MRGPSTGRSIHLVETGLVVVCPAAKCNAFYAQKAIDSFVDSSSG